MQGGGRGSEPCTYTFLGRSLHPIIHRPFLITHSRENYLGQSEIHQVSRHLPWRVPFILFCVETEGSGLLMSALGDFHYLESLEAISGAVLGLSYF